MQRRLPVIEGRFDILFARLFGDSPEGSGRLSAVDRIVSLVCGILGLPLLLLQIYKVGGPSGLEAVPRGIGLVAVAVTAIVCLCCALQFFSDLSTRLAPRLAAVLLFTVTLMSFASGIDTRLPGAPLGPMTFFLIVVVGTEWRHWWPVAFIVGFSAWLPLVSSHWTVPDAVSAGLALSYHGLGFRLTIRAMQRQEHSVQVAALSARLNTVRVHEQSVALLERVHWDTLVHDNVINVLRSASTAQDDAAPWLKAEAHRTLALMNARATSSSSISPVEVERRLAAVVQGISPGAELTVQNEAPEAQYSTSVMASMIAAAGEALRNAVRHSHADSIEVLARLSPGSVRILVADDGVGFDRRRIRPTAMGIRGSIEGRMARSGCAATVRSAPGEGTLVDLSYVAGEAATVPA